MANENRVELVIRAKDLAKKSIVDLADTIDRLQNELEQVDRAGGPASRSVAELKQQLDDLKAVADEIGRRKLLVEQFNLQTTAVSKLSGELERAKAAHNAYKDTLAGVAKQTKEQKETLAALAKEVKTANTSYQRASGTLDSYGRQMADLGLSAQTAAADLAALAAQEQRLDAAALRAETNLRTRDAALRQLNEASKEKAAAEKLEAERLKATATLQETVAAGAERLARARRAAQEVGADTTRVDRFADNRLRPEVLQTAERAERAYAAAVRATEAAIAARNAELARDKFRATADEATKAAEAARGLAQALKLPEPTTNAKAIEAIVSPAKAAAANLSTVAATLDRIDALPVAEQFQAVKASAGTLDEALKRVGAAAKSLDTLVAQKDALREANSQFLQAQRRLEELAAQVRASEAPNAALLKTFRDQQEVVQRTAAAVQQAGQRYLDTRAALREFGVDTRDAAAAQQQLASTAQRIIATQRDAATTAAQRAEAERALAEKLKANLPLQQAIEAGERKLAAARKEAAAAGADTTRVDRFADNRLRPEMLQTAQRAERAYAAAVAATERALQSRNAELARDKFRATAEEATKAAEAARGLAQALKLPEPTTNAKAIEAIVSPAKAAAANLSTVAATLDRIDALPVAEQFQAVKASAGTLDEALKRVGAAAKSLDTLVAQKDALREANSQFLQAQRRLEELAAQVRASEAPNAALLKTFRDQQETVQRTAAAVQQAGQRYLDTRTALREFGVDTRDVVAAQQQLASTAQRIIATQRDAATTAALRAEAERALAEKLKANLPLQQAIEAGERKLAAARKEAAAAGADLGRVDAFKADTLRPEVLQTAQRAERAYAAAVAATERALQARNAELARDKFRATADEATKAAESARGLAQALKLPEPTTNAKAIEAIVSPAKAAAANLSTVAATLDRIDALPVAEQFQAVKASAGTLDEALKRVGAAAKSLDTLVAQKDALREANSQFLQAQRRLEELAAQVRASEAPNAALLKTFRDQQEVVQRTAAAVQQAGQRYLDTRAALREFGVDTRDVVAAQQQLASTAQRIIATQRDAATTAALRAEAERALAEKLKANLPLQQAIEAGERKLAAARKEAAAAGADLARVDAFKADTLRPEVLRTAERAERAYAAAVAATGQALQARKAEVARDEFRGLANNANVAAEAARGLARALALPEPKLNSAAVAAIIQPAKEAGTTLGGLAAVLERVNAVPVRANTKAQFDALRDSAAPLAEALRRVEQAAKGLDALNAQQAAVQRAGQAYADARAKLRDLAQQVARASAPSADLKRAFEQQQAVVQRAGQTLGEAATQFRATRAELRAFGVDTRSAAAAGKQLQTAATDIVAAQKKVAAGTAETTRAFRLWGEGGRTTLSYAQRLRGEFLAMTTSIVGLYSAITVGQSALDAASSREQTIKQLVLITGSAEEARAKYEQLGRTADEVGVNFAAASKGYTDIAFAAREAGVSASEVDRFYKNLLLTTRDLSLSGQQTERIFYAVSQIFSKNKLSSEELTQQLGESLKGILGVSAQAAGVTGKEFQKALEGSQFTGDAIIGIIDKYREKLAGLGGQQDGYVQAQARFENALRRIKEQLADTGFLDAATDALKTLTAAANNGEFKAGVQALGAAFTGLAKSIIFVVENLGWFATAAGIIVGGKLIGWAAEAVAAMRAFALTTGAATLSLNGLSAALLAVPGVGWILAAVGALALLDKSFEAVHETVVLVTGAFAEFLGLFTVSGPTAWLEQARGAAARLAEQFKRTKEAWFGPDETVPAPQAPAAGAGGGRGNADAQLAAWRERAATTAAGAKIAAQAQEGALKKIDDALEKGFQSTNRKIAENRGDLLSAAKEQYKEVQAEIDDLAKRDAVAAAKRQAELDRLIKATVQANAPKGGNGLQALKAANAAAIEAIKNDIEQAKTLIEAGLKDLDRAFEDNLLGIEEYYARRSAAARAAEVAEVDGLLKQIALLEVRRTKDPEAAKAIEDAYGRIVAASNRSTQAQKENTRAAAQAIAQTRQQFAQAQNNLDAARGDTLTPALMEARAEYVRLLELASRLSGEERKRAELIAKQTYELHVQTAQLQDVAARQDHLRALSQAAVDAAGLGPFGQAAAQQEINREQMARLEALAEKYRSMGMAGSAAYRAIEVEIVKLGAQTDLVADKIAGIASAATDDLIAEMMRKGSSVSDWFRAFGLSLADSLSKAFAEEASAGIQKAMREAVKAAMSGQIGNWFAGLFSGGAGATGGGATMVTTAHVGALIGYGSGNHRSSRTFDPVALSAAVASAPRYHTGAAGLGLRSDEVLAVLKKQEEVLSAEDPRNILNGGAAARPGVPAAAPAAQPNIKIINTIDPVSVVNEGLGTAAGEKVLINSLAKNARTVRKVLGV